MSTRSSVKDRLASKKAQMASFVQNVSAADNGDEARSAAEGKGSSDAASQPQSETAGSIERLKAFAAQRQSVADADALTRGSSSAADNGDEARSAAEGKGSSDAASQPQSEIAGSIERLKAFAAKRQNFHYL